MIRVKEQFKQFVKKNPSLIKYVESKDMTWQKFYEMYDLYGESSDVWKKYLVSDNNKGSVGDVSKTSAFADFLAFLKTIDLDSLQEGIRSIQIVLGVFQEFSGNKIVVDNEKKEYKSSPLYKHFED